MKERIIVLMGVSGCGKTVVGKVLAERLHLPFVEGDDFHSSGNIAKMSAGIPLDDGDRTDWMSAIREAMQLQTGSAIVSCSTLKRKFRCFLSDISKTVQFVYLQGDRELLEKRITSRIGHFFDPKLLDSQFSSLEEPSPEEGIMTIDITGSVEKIVATIHASLEALNET